MVCVGQELYDGAVEQSKELLAGASEVNEMYALLAAFEQRTPTVDQVCAPNFWRLSTLLPRWKCTDYPQVTVGGQMNLGSKLGHRNQVCTLRQ